MRASCIVVSSDWELVSNDVLVTVTGISVGVSNCVGSEFACSGVIDVGEFSRFIGGAVKAKPKTGL